MIIETERLILREWQLDDVDAMVDGLSNFDVAKYLTVPFPYTKENAVDFIEKHNKNDESNYYFAVTKKSNGAVIGGTSLSCKDDTNLENGGLWLNQKFHNNGYGTELWYAMIKFWFSDKSRNVLISGYYSFNNASEKLHKKLGFKVVGKKKQFCPALKEDVDAITVRLTRDDFEQICLSKNI